MTRTDQSHHLCLQVQEVLERSPRYAVLLHWSTSQANWVAVQIAWKEQIVLDDNITPN